MTSRHPDFDVIFRQYAKRFGAAKGEPYPNEHACRLVDPTNLDIIGSEERDHEGKKYRIIFGKPKDDPNAGAVEQAYRYPKDTWPAEQASAHCRDHNGIEFSAATAGEREHEVRREYAIWRYAAFSDSKVDPDCAELQARLFTSQGLDEELRALFPYGEGNGLEFKPNVHPNCRCRMVRIYAGEAYESWRNSFDPPLDDTKPLPVPLPHRKGEAIVPTILEVGPRRKEQGASRTYLVTALHVGSTGKPGMVDRDGLPRLRHFTEDELLRRASTLAEKGGGLNHVYYPPLERFFNRWAEYDAKEKAVKAIVDVSDDLINGLYDKGEIVNASVEFHALDYPQVDGVMPYGIIFDGLHFLTKDVQPGDPKTKVQLISSLVKPGPGLVPATARESADVIMSKEVKEKMENITTTETEKKEITTTTTSPQITVTEQLSTADENNLPDGAFAYIAPGGTKDNEGKTVPRSLRKLPHHKQDGSVDIDQLRAALRYLPKTDLPASALPEVRAHLEKHAKDVLPSYQEAVEELTKFLESGIPDKKVESQAPEGKKTEVVPPAPAEASAGAEAKTSAGEGKPEEKSAPEQKPQGKPEDKSEQKGAGEQKPPQEKAEQKPPEPPKEISKGVGFVAKGDEVVEVKEEAPRIPKYEALLNSLPTPESLRGHYPAAYVRRIVETVRKELEGETA